MSINLMSAIFRTEFRDLQDLKGNTTKASTAKFVCIALADHANDEGEGAYPSLHKLAYKTSLSRTTIINALDALKHNGILTANGTSKWDTVNYTVNSFCFSQDSTPLPLAIPVKPLDSPSQATIPLPVKPLDPNHTITIHKPSFNDNDEKTEIDRRTAILSRLYSNNIGAITPMTADILKDTAETYPDETWYPAAFEIAVKNNARNLAYIETVLRNWRDKGRDWAPKMSYSKHGNLQQTPTLEEALAKAGYQ